MVKHLPLAISALTALLCVVSACQGLESTGDVMAPLASAPSAPKVAKALGRGNPARTASHDLVVVYSTNNDGEIDPCG